MCIRDSNKCDAIPPQALHRMKVDDIAAVTLFKILCRQEFFHLRECERIALRFIVCINDAAVVACLHIQYFCEEVSVLLGNTALQHDAPALFETAIPGDIIHCSVDAFLLHGLDDIVLCVHLSLIHISPRRRNLPRRNQALFPAASLSGSRS